MSVPPQGKKCNPDVVRLCGDAPSTQLRCPECNLFAVKGRKYSKDEDWSVLLYCACSIEWVICSKCTGHRTRMRKTQQYHFHKHSKHGSASREAKSEKKKLKISQDEDTPMQAALQPVRLSDAQEEKDMGNAVLMESVEANSNSYHLQETSIDTTGKTTTTAGDEIIDQEILQNDSPNNFNAEDGDIPLSNTTMAIWEVNDCPEETKQQMLLMGNKEGGSPDESRTSVFSSSSFSAHFSGTKESKDFFWEEHKQNRGGVRSIVAKSEFGITTMLNDIDTRDVQYSTEVAHFCHGLSRGQRDHFANIMRMTIEKIERDRLSGKSKPWKVSIPCSSIHIRRHITEYPSAFLSLIPSIAVNTLPGPGSFAYVNLRDCVQNFLAYGYVLDTVPSLSHTKDCTTTKVTESPYCKERYLEIKNMYSSPVLVLWLVEWSDGYDPHGFSKTNRGSAWVKVITFVPPPINHNSVGYTYPMALGPSTGDHDIVEKRFREELLELSDPENTNNMFYSGLQKQFVRVHVELLVSLMDQPERRGANYLTRGNSKLGARWGYSILLEAVKEQLVPCDRCSSKLLRGDLEWNKVPCNTCAQWDMDKNPTRLKWKCGDQFPLEECNGGEGYLVPIRLTYEAMKDAVRKAESNIISGSWTRSNINAYLSYFGMNVQVIDGITSRAENIRLLNLAEENKGNDPAHYATVKEMSADDIEKFSPFPFPALWDRGVTLRQHIDVLMHLIFLGAVDGTIQFVHTWLKLHGKYAGFMRLAEKRLKDIRSLNLHWCKAMLYKGEKLGGWVSENYLAFARLCKWFFLIGADLGKDEPDFVEPKTPQKNWTAKVNRQWLKVRALETSGKAQELRARVSFYMNLAEGPPPVADPPGGTIMDVFSLVSTMNDMVKSVMVTSVGDAEVRRADMCIKRFLTVFAQLDKKVNKDKDKVQWISSYTYPCLLNLPDTMKAFGPMKNFWEGGVRGEGSLRIIKPAHGTIGLKVGWPKLVMERVVKIKALTNISGGQSTTDWYYNKDEGEEDLVLDEHNYGNREFFKYPAEAMIFMSYEKNFALSVVQTECGKVGLVTKMNTIVVLFRRKPELNLLLHGIPFLHWSLSDERGNIIRIGLSSVTIAYAFLLLPHDSAKNCYFGVRSDWKEMDISGNFV